MTDDVRSRSARALGLEAEVTGEDAAEAFLRGLPAADFLPPAEAVAAVNALAGLAVPSDAEAGASLRDEVEDFARRYWSLSPSERMTTWLGLSSRSPDDPTAARLVALQAGLELPPAPFADPAAELVASAARELYVLPPRERAVRRNAWLLANAYHHYDLVTAAATVRKSAPAFAELDPVLFERLTSRFNARVFQSGATDETLPPHAVAAPEPASFRSSPTGSPASFSYSSDAPTPSSARPRARPTSTDSGSGDWKMGWLVFGLLIFAVRVLSALGGSGSSNTPKPVDFPKNLVIPTTPPVKQFGDVPPVCLPEGVQKSFTPAEVAAFKMYERAQERGLNPQPPLNYAYWFLLGRPEASDFTAWNQPPADNSSSTRSPLPPASGPMFTPAEVRLFQDYDRRGNGPVPIGYQVWVAAGKPEPTRK